MTCKEYQIDLKKLSEEQIYNKYIIGGQIWFFEQTFGSDWFEKYNDFRIFISDKLGVHYNDIAIAGSAKLGFSINPLKNYKIFDEYSDIDIIIISQKYFYEFWEAYRNDAYSEIRLNNFKKVCFSIFRRYMIFDGLNEMNETYARWLKKTQGFEKDLQLEFGISNDIHYRIFESWDAAKDYYLSTIRKNMKEERGAFMARINDLIKNENQTVKWIKDRFGEENLFVDNSFQRRYVWLKKHQVNLIETILMGYVIPEIYIWEVGTDPESGETKYSIVDGQQRIGAIISYINGKYPLYAIYLSESNADYAGKYFYQLSDEDKKCIWGYSLSFRKILSEVSRDDIVNLFLRLNSTDKSLNPQELRNAEYNGLFLQNAIKISSLPFWEKYKIFSADAMRRMGDVEFISSLLIFLRKGIDSEITQTAINQIYDLYNEEYDEAEEDSCMVAMILNELERIINNTGGEIIKQYIRKTTHLYTMFTVIYKYVAKNQKIADESIDRFFSFYNNYETSSDKRATEYRELYQGGTRSKQNRMRRTKILTDVIEN